jgi:hypothetical protein
MGPENFENSDDMYYWATFEIKKLPKNKQLRNRRKFDQSGHPAAGKIGILSILLQADKTFSSE